MNILIKGMEMPESCEDCPLIQTSENYYGDVMSQSCNLIYKGYLSGVPRGERRKDCPLIEVPPHGRLIDADALDKHIYNDIPIKVFGNVTRMARIRDIVCEAPTVIPDDKDGET